MQGNLQQMFNPQKLIDRLFRRAENVVWDMSTGRTGYRTKDGIVTLEIEGDDPDKTFQTTINPIDGMGMEVPAFAQQTALDAVKVGDMILTASSVGWVTALKPKSISLIKPDGTHTTFTPPKTQLLDFGSGVMVVRSLLNTLPGGEAGLGGMANMLMMVSMMGGGNVDLEKMMPMMLMMNGAGGTATNSATTGPMAAMQGMMPMMMMMQMMNGQVAPKPQSGMLPAPKWPTKSDTNDDWQNAHSQPRFKV